MVDAVRRARYAVGTTFALNGVAFANLVPRYPEIKAAIGLDNAAFGAAVACWPLGALASGLLADVAVTRWTSARVILVASMAMIVFVSGTGFATSLLALALVFAGVGLVDSLIDIGNNAQGLWVQRRLGRSIITGLHGLWSAGAVARGLIGSAFAGLGVPVRWHLIGVGAVIAAAVVVTSRFVLIGLEHTVVAKRSTPSGGRPSAGVVVQPAADRPRRAGRRGRRGCRQQLGSAVPDRCARHREAAVGGAAFVAMQTTMITGRFAGDPLVGGGLTVLGIAVLMVGLRWAFALPAVLGVLAIGCAGPLAGRHREPVR